MNFYAETLRALEQSGYTIDSVLRFQDIDIDGEFVTLNKPIFIEVAKSINYDNDNDYGTEEISPSLRMIMKDDTWFERDRCDGAEWWAHRYPESEPRFAIGDFDRIRNLVYLNHAKEEADA